MIWADKGIFKLLKDLETQEITRAFNRSSNTIMAKLIHLAEEYMAWLYDITNQPIGPEVEKIESLDHNEIIHYIYKFHQEWLNYLSKTTVNEYEIDEGKFKVKINLDEVIFNLVNHASYHRGQIVTLLRMLNREVTITDYYWFKINKLRSNHANP